MTIQISQVDRGSEKLQQIVSPRAFKLMNDVGFNSSTGNNISQVLIWRSLHRLVIGTKSWTGVCRDMEGAISLCLLISVAHIISLMVTVVGRLLVLISNVTSSLLTGSNSTTRIGAGLEASRVMVLSLILRNNPGKDSFGHCKIEKV